jgi:hypothetical protein
LKFSLAESTIFLPDCNIGNIGASDPKEPLEFLITEKSSGGFLAQSVKYKFKAPTNDQNEFWHALILSLSKVVVPRKPSLPSPSAVQDRLNAITINSSTPSNPASAASKSTVAAKSKNADSYNRQESIQMMDEFPPMTPQPQPQTTSSIPKAQANFASFPSPNNPPSPTHPTFAPQFAHNTTSVSNFQVDDYNYGNEAEVNPTLRGRAPPADLLAMKASFIDNPVVDGEQGRSDEGEQIRNSSWSANIKPWEDDAGGNVWG